MTGHNGMTRIVLALALTLAVTGCGPGEEAPAVGVADSALVEANGLSPNGLSRNGLSRNGLSRNGLSRNGLSRNGLLTTEFQGWFAEDPATSAAVMTYIVRCAAPAGQSLSFTSPTSGLSYTWTGSLGLAPGWASGLVATVAEEQVITACLAAHVNKYGIHVPIAIEGRSAAGVQIAVSPGELTGYSVKEACFFGNLFEGEGVFVGLDHASWDAKTSSVRACALDHQRVGPSIDCPPIFNVESCSKRCKLDATRTFYESCTWNGKTYRPVTTRLRPQEIYKCGDGVCQLTEKCGTGSTADSCKADCGLCP